MASRESARTHHPSTPLQQPVQGELHSQAGDAAPVGLYVHPPAGLHHPTPPGVFPPQDSPMLITAVPPGHVPQPPVLNHHLHAHLPAMPQPVVPQSVVQSVSIDESQAVVSSGSKRKYQCMYDGCGKLFGKPSALNRHVRTHTGDKPFNCPHEDCNMRFAERGNMRRHIKTHQQVRNFVCLVDNCNRRFARRAHVEHHCKSQHRKFFNRVTYLPRTRRGKGGWLVEKGKEALIPEDESMPPDPEAGEHKMRKRRRPRRVGNTSKDGDKDKKRKKKPSPQLRPRMQHSTLASKDITMSDYMRDQVHTSLAGELKSTNPLALPPPPLSHPDDGHHLPFPRPAPHEYHQLSIDPVTDVHKLLDEKTAPETAHAVGHPTISSRGPLGDASKSHGMSEPAPENRMLPYARISFYTASHDLEQIQMKMRSSKEGKCSGDCCMNLKHMGHFDVSKGSFASPCEDRSGLVECGSLCGCPTACFNRAVAEQRRKEIGRDLAEAPVFGLDPYTRVNVYSALEKAIQGEEAKHLGDIKVDFDFFIDRILLPALNSIASNGRLPKPLEQAFVPLYASHSPEVISALVDINRGAQATSPSDVMMKARKLEKTRRLFQQRWENTRASIVKAEEKRMLNKAKTVVQSWRKDMKATGVLMFRGNGYQGSKVPRGDQLVLPGKILVPNYPASAHSIPFSTTLPIPSGSSVEAWVLAKMQLPAEMEYAALQRVKLDAVAEVDEENIEEEWRMHGPIPKDVTDMEMKGAERSETAGSGNDDEVGAPPVPTEHMKMALQRLSELEFDAFDDGSNRGAPMDQAIVKFLSKSLIAQIDSVGSHEFLVEKKGAGVICTAETGIRVNEFVSEYFGEVCPPWRWSEKQAAVRALQKKGRHVSTYSMVLERHSDDKDGYDILYLDPTRAGSSMSRLSHSCKPNCATVAVVSKGHFVLAVYALRDIRQGEELTIDYCLVTEDEGVYKDAVCLCGMAECRYSHYYFTGGGVFRPVLSAHYSPLARAADLVLACERRSEAVRLLLEPSISLLAKHGLKASVFGRLPNWAVSFAALAMEFLEYELRTLPNELLTSSEQYTEESASAQAKGVFDIRLQNLVVALNELEYILRHSPPELAASPPFTALTVPETIDFLWRAPNSVVQRLWWAASSHLDAGPLQTLKAHVFSRLDPSADDLAQLRFVKDAMVKIAYVLWALNSTTSAYFLAAGDLLYLYANTDTFYKPTLYRSFRSAEFASEELDPTGRLDAQPSREYGPLSAWACLMNWYRQRPFSCENQLKEDLLAGLELPCIESCFADKDERLSHSYGAKERKALLASLANETDNWRGSFWKLSSQMYEAKGEMYDPFGAGPRPLVQGRGLEQINRVQDTHEAVSAYRNHVTRVHGSLSSRVSLDCSLDHSCDLRSVPIIGSPMLDNCFRPYVKSSLLEAQRDAQVGSVRKALNNIIIDMQLGPP